MILTCNGCGKPFQNTIDTYAVCMDCVRARHRAVVKRGRCTCGAKRRELPVSRVGSRTWIPCGRCLGTVRQLS